MQSMNKPSESHKWIMHWNDVKLTDRRSLKIWNSQNFHENTCIFIRWQAQMAPTKYTTVNTNTWCTNVQGSLHVPFCSLRLVLTHHFTVDASSFYFCVAHSRRQCRSKRLPPCVCVCVSVRAPFILAHGGECGLFSLTFYSCDAPHQLHRLW